MTALQYNWPRLPAKSHGKLSDINIKNYTVDQINQMKSFQKNSKKFYQIDCTVDNWLITHKILNPLGDEMILIKYNVTTRNNKLCDGKF